jgi:hypothetical protein
MDKLPSKVIEYLLGPPGNPIPGVPTADAVARKLGLTDPMGKTAHFASYKSSHPTEGGTEDGSLYPMLREEMVSKIAQK